MSRNATSYFVPTTSKTLDILEAFHSPTQELTLEEVITRAKVARTTAFRILHTLEQRRYVTRRGKRYHLNPIRKKIRLGFGSLTTELPFACAVVESLTQAASQSGIELSVYDNHRDSEAAVNNARRMVAERVNVAIEFQRHVEVTPMIADIFSTAQIPLIAVHIPHPGAIYFGVNNYQTGMCAGRALATAARDRFQGHFDLLILLDIPEGGIVLQSRMSGVLQGMKEILGTPPEGRIARVAGGAERAVARSAVKSILAKKTRTRRLLIAAASDDGGMGAMDAVNELGLAGSSVIVGMEGSQEAIRQVARDESPYVGTVAYHPEKYGPALIDLVFRLINGEQVPPFWYVGHQFIDLAKARKLTANAVAT